MLNILRIRSHSFRVELLTMLIWLSAAAQMAVATTADPKSELDPTPKYKPSSRSPEPLDIRLDVYGASRIAPAALRIGDVVPDFSLPRAGGGVVSLASARAKGPVVLIFYRGHW